jgi:AcrR family transcriptional regulator
VVSSPIPRNKQRARSDDDKELRRQHILTTAKGLWSIHTFGSFTMNALADTAGLAKGTLYLYFKTKEEVFLALLSDALARWFELLLQQLILSDIQLEPAALATLLVNTFAQVEQLDRLLPSAASVFEHNISREAVVGYKTFLLSGLAKLSQALNTRADYLAGRADVFLTQVYALLAGFGQMADPAPQVAEVLKDESMALMRLDLLPMSQATLETLLLGHLATWQQQQKNSENP